MKDAGKVLFFTYEAPIAWNTGVALLSALLKQAGAETSLFVGDGWNQDDWKELLSKAPKTTYICFSHVIMKDYKLSIPYIEIALELGFHVIFGGTYHRRNNPNPYDGKVLICRGEGEELVKYVLTGDAEVFKKQHVCYDLNALPLPDYDLFKDYPYDGHIINFPEMTKLPYNTSRGCVGTCSFCEVQHQFKTPRVRTKVSEDLKQLRKTYKFDLLFITDELAPYYSKEWRDSWEDEKQDFFAFIRADIQPDILEWMLEIGMKGCAFGVESGDEAFRNKAMNKRLSDEQVFRTVDILDKSGIYYAHFYMLKYPGETFSQQLATYKMAKKLKGQPMIFEYSDVTYGTRSL